MIELSGGGVKSAGGTGRGLSQRLTRVAGHWTIHSAPHVP